MLFATEILTRFNGKRKNVGCYPQGLARIYVYNNPALSDFIKTFMLAAKKLGLHERNKTVLCISRKQ